MASARKRPAESDAGKESVPKKARFEVHHVSNPTTPSSPPSTFFTEAASIADTSATSRATSKRPKRYVCDFDGCSKAFDRPVRLQAHIRTHTDDRPFACEEVGCDKRYYKCEHLKAHVQEKHTTDTVYVCPYVISTSDEGEELHCGKTLATASKLKRHLAMHESKEELKCQEVGCGQVFRKMETLQRHVKKDHLAEKAFRCTHTLYETTDIEFMPEECGQAFSTVGQLKAHENREHAGLKYFCEICSPPPADTEDGDDIDAAMSELQRIGFLTYTDLQNHNKVVHPPTCTTCGKACESNRALAAHMDIEHSSLSERQKYACTWPGCDRSFTRAGNLKVHVQTLHAKAKEFVCGEFDLVDNPRTPGWHAGIACGAAYTTKATLEGHVRTKHLDLAAPSRASRLKETKKEANDEEESSLSSLMELEEPSALLNRNTAISMLTGHGYDACRPLTCWTSGCPVRFARELDLAQHMELAHGLDVDDINDRLAETAALEGGDFWIGGEALAQSSGGGTDYGPGESVYIDSAPLPAGALSRAQGKLTCDMAGLHLQHGGRDEDVMFAVDPALLSGTF